MNLEFRDLKIEDKVIVENFTRGKKIYGWEYNFAMMWCWNVFDTTKIFIDENMIIIYTVFYDNTVFFPPIVADGYDINIALTLIKEYCAQSDIVMSVKGIDSQYIQPSFSDIYKISSNENDFDYIYNTSDLSALVGKKYHSKRNYVTRFESGYSFEFAQYSDSDFAALMELYDKWYVKSVHETLDLERRAIVRALTFYKELELKIGVLRVDGIVVAYSISNIFDEIGHAMFEKGDINYVGVYQEINKLTVLEFFGSVMYVNRQEDMGIAGLRKVKQSYYPAIFLPKYVIEAK